MSLSVMSIWKHRVLRVLSAASFNFRQIPAVAGGHLTCVLLQSAGAGTVVMFFLSSVTVFGRRK